MAPQPLGKDQLPRQLILHSLKSRQWQERLLGLQNISVMGVVATGDCDWLACQNRDTPMGMQTFLAFFLPLEAFEVSGVSGLLPHSISECPCESEYFWSTVSAAMSAGFLG